MVKVLRILIPILGLAFFLLLIFVINSLLINPIGSEEENQAEKEYHFAFFLPSFDYYFFQDLKLGAIDAAEAMNSAISFLSIDSEEGGFSYASQSGFDGIALYAYGDDSSLKQGLAEIHSTGMPLVLIETELSDQTPSFFIGSNSFDSGKAIGRLALNSGLNEMDLVLVYSEKNPGLLSDSRLVEMGISETLGDRNVSIETKISDLNPLDAEKLTYDIVRASQKTDVIVLTDLNDTLVTVQAIIDLNLVGQIQVIGFGDNEMIRNYIDKGIMLGSIVRNPYRIGFSTVMALHDLSKYGYTSAYVDTGISLLTSNEPPTSLRDYGNQ